MENTNKYNPKEIESKWYQFWLEQRLFNSRPNSQKKPYCILMPPPNITGILHMGHMLNNTIQDVLVRKARMEGKEALWIPGTDHASIATEAKVVKMLRDLGIQKNSLSRQEFLAHCWDWNDKYGGIILQQLRKLGASCDWERTRFTMEESLSNDVIDVFIDLYNKGEIYKGNRIVNWDPEAQTTISDEEIIYVEKKQKMYYLRYDGDDISIVVATVRPETIMADVAIAVNPRDARYKEHIGKMVKIPLINKEIPIIADSAAKVEFGTGALKITPGHSADDFNVGIKHSLPFIDIFNKDATLNDNAQILVGLDRFEARTQIEELLQESGSLIKTEPISSSIGTSERTGSIIEPRLSLQWFLRMDRLAKPALDKVLDETIKFLPPKFKNSYKHWMENGRDWCISRQLWWGHQIPAFYTPDGICIVAKTKVDALKIANLEHKLNINIDDLVQDEDVLDTWFSSWLWPISVFDGFKNPDNEDIKYYYPTDDLVTAPEILFFWVARMIISGYEYKKLPPFKNVYLTGIVRDKSGKKMSKSLGNSPDPIELIEKYGADGVRTGMMFSSPAGNDLLFDEKFCEQGRNFANKIWNASYLINSWNISFEIDIRTNASNIEWFRAKLNKSIVQINKDFLNFRLSEALMATYTLIWDDFCGKYLEMIKPPYSEGKQKKIDVFTMTNTIGFFDELIRLLHPWMPFITEEIWQNLEQRASGDSICVSNFPQNQPYDETILSEFEIAFEVISYVRNYRNTEKISPKESLILVNNSTSAQLSKVLSTIEKLANVSVSYKIDDSDLKQVNFKVGELDLSLHIRNSDNNSHKESLQKELEYVLGFKKSVEIKLSNHKFISHANPDLVIKERQKLSDAETKIKHLSNSLASF